MAFTDNTTGGRVILEGVMPVSLVLTDTCEVGDPIGYDESSEVWEQADADGKVIASFIAAERCETSGDTIKCYKQVVMDGFTSAVAGDPIYIGNTPGAYTAYPESWIHQQIGTMVSATVGVFTPSAEALFGMSVHGRGWGGYIRAVLNDDQATQTGQIWGGLRVDYKAVSTATMGGDTYGLYIFAQLQAVPSVSYSHAILRIEDGCSSTCGVESYITFVNGSGDPPDYFFKVGSTGTTDAWSDDLTCTATDGWLKIMVGTSTRYIILYTDTPS